MSYLLPVFLVLAVNSLYLLECALGVGEDILDERRLGAPVPEELLFQLVIRLFFLASNLAGLWLCLFSFLSR